MESLFKTVSKHIKELYYSIPGEAFGERTFPFKPQSALPSPTSRARDVYAVAPAVLSQSSMYGELNHGVETTMSISDSVIDLQYSLFGYDYLHQLCKYIYYIANKIYQYSFAIKPLQSALQCLLIRCFDTDYNGLKCITDEFW